MKISEILNEMSDKERDEFENSKTLKSSMTVEKYEKKLEGFLDKACELPTDHIRKKM